MNFQPGDAVSTTKGCQYKGRFSGTVVSIGRKWRDFPAVVVQKHDGRKVLCLEKNLVKLTESK